MAKSKPAFAPMPLRALVDSRLAFSHHKVLGVVCAHDHMSLARETGAGCYISNQRLAALANLNYSVASKTVNDLERWGYIVRERRADDARQKTIRVIYNDADATAFRNALAQGAPAQNVCAETNDLRENVCRQQNNDEEIVCLAEEHFQAFSNTSPSEYIPLKGEIDSVKQGNRFSKAAQPPSPLARAVDDILAFRAITDDEVMARLSIIERQLKQTGFRADGDLTEALEQIYLGSDSTALSGRAERLLSSLSQDETDEEAQQPAPSLADNESNESLELRSTVSAAWSRISEFPNKRAFVEREAKIPLSDITAYAQGHHRLSSAKARTLLAKIQLA